MIRSAWLRDRRGLLLGLGIALLAVLGLHLGLERLHARELARAEAAAQAEAVREVEATRLMALRSLDAIDALDRVLRERHALLAQDNLDGARAMEALARRVVARRAFGILQVALIGGDGLVAWSSVDGWQPVDLSDRAHFRAHLPQPDGSSPAPDRLFVSEPLVGRVSNRPTLQFSRAIREADGRLAAVTVVSLDPVDLSGLLRELVPSDRGIVSLLREDAIFLARSTGPDGTIGRAMRPDSPTRAMLLAGMEGEVRSRTTIENRDVFVALRRLQGTPLFIAANIDAAAALAGPQKLRALMHAGELAFAVIALGAVWLLHQRRQRRRGQTALAAAETLRQELALVLDGLPGAAFRAEVDAAGEFRFLYGSRAIATLTGLRRAELETLAQWQARVEAMDPPGELADVPRRAAAEGRYGADLLFRRADGTRRWLRATLQALRRHPDGRTELVGYTSDVTEQREAQAALMASAKMATLGEMATGLAHELNQPVSTMALAAENAGNALRRRGEAAIPDALARLERIGLLAQRAKGIIDHLRSFGRVDPGTLEPVALSDAIGGAITLTGVALREARIAVTVDLPDGLPPIRGRRLLVEQVLINLLLNARDAIAGAGMAEGRIILTAREAGEWVTLTVADSGPGVPATLLPRLFEPFFTTKPTGQGTGLGLSLCHGIMESLGGGITAANGDQGAEFRLRLRTDRAVPPRTAAPEDGDPPPGRLQPARAG